MREATPAEAAELNQRTHREQSDAIRALIKNPDVWYHINPGDAAGRNLEDQMEKLEVALPLECVSLNGRVLRR
jgi:hypothetical protein